MWYSEKLFESVAAEFDNKDIVQDLNRLLHFPKGSQQNSAVMCELLNIFFNVIVYFTYL